ncbi:MAG: anti-sigma factor [Hyphomicrobiaceae bacterium]
MTDREDMDMLAAEYVLGSLDAAERAAVAARRQREPLLDQAIHEWQRRLSPLDAAVADVPPPPALFEKIAARTFAAVAVGEETAAGRAPEDAAEPARQTVVSLERRLGLWRRATIAMSAIAAALALMLGYRETLRHEMPQNFVAVFQKDDQQPAFVLAIDLETRQIVVRPVTAEPLEQRTYQLWIVDPAVSPVPRSLGLIESSLKQPTRKTLASLEPEVLRRATFGISQEPPGGSPTGRPTGPALHGRLIPAAP